MGWYFGDKYSAATLNPPTVGCAMYGARRDVVFGRSRPVQRRSGVLGHVLKSDASKWGLWIPILIVLDGVVSTLSKCTAEGM